MTLQAKVYGGHRHQAPVLKKGGIYNNPPMRQMGVYNHQVKRLGVYNGVGGSKGNVIGEMYPHY